MQQVARGKAAAGSSLCAAGCFDEKIRTTVSFACVWRGVQHNERPLCVNGFLVVVCLQMQVSPTNSKACVRREEEGEWTKRVLAVLSMMFENGSQIRLSVAEPFFRFIVVGRMAQMHQKETNRPAMLVSQNKIPRS